MNIFLPYENDIRKSVKSLDDLRLNKQILETYQLLRLAIDESKGVDISKRGYKKHPIYLHYKKDLYFLALYGYFCCDEFLHRFNKHHKLRSYFYYIKNEAMVLWVFEKTKKDEKHDTFEYTPFYMEGSKGKPNYIRTTENVGELYQQRLINKWQNDKRQPKWTNREMPSFYIEYLDLIG
jgi:hypothetical protein